MENLNALGFLEDDIFKAYKSVQGAEEGHFYSSFGAGKKLYESDLGYKQLVDEWERFQKEVSPEILKLYQKTLSLRVKWREQD